MAKLGGMDDHEHLLLDEAAAWWPFLLVQGLLRRRPVEKKLADLLD